MKNFMNNRGVTLIELIAAMAILLIVLLMGNNLYKYSINAYENDNIDWQIQQKSRKAIAIISQDIKSASGINLPDNKTVTLSMPGGKTITYSVDTLSNTLIKQVSGSSPEIVASDIDSIQYNKNGDMVSIALIAKKGSKNYTVSTQVYNRVKP